MRKGFTAAWRQPWDRQWEESCLVTEGVEKTIQSAKACIDYLLVVRAMERTLGKKLEWNELPKCTDLSDTTIKQSILGRTGL